MWVKLSTHNEGKQANQEQIFFPSQIASKIEPYTKPCIEHVPKRQQIPLRW